MRDIRFQRKLLHTSDLTLTYVCFHSSQTDIRRFDYSVLQPVIPRQELNTEYFSAEWTICRPPGRTVSSSVLVGSATASDIAVVAGPIIFKFLAWALGSGVVGRLARGLA